MLLWACTDRLPTLPFEPLRIFAIIIYIARIITRVHQNLRVGKPLWEKTITHEESYRFLGSFGLVGYLPSPFNVYYFERCFLVLVPICVKIFALLPFEYNYPFGRYLPHWHEYLRRGLHNSSLSCHCVTKVVTHAHWQRAPSISPSRYQFIVHGVDLRKGCSR